MLWSYENHQQPSISREKLLNSCNNTFSRCYPNILKAFIFQKTINLVPFDRFFDLFHSSGYNVRPVLSNRLLQKEW